MGAEGDGRYKGGDATLGGSCMIDSPKPRALLNQNNLELGTSNA